MYYAVVSALNSEVLSYVSDSVKNPPNTDLYLSLKKRLVVEFADSEQKRVKDFLMDTVLGIKSYHNCCVKCDSSLRKY